MAPVSTKEQVEKVRMLIAEQLGVDESEVTPSASFTDDLGADSLDLVELVMAMEEAYGFQVSDEDTEGMRTVKDAIDYVERRAKSRK
jgi:acyl carrier protein